MLSDVSDTKYCELSPIRDSPQELGFRTFHGADCGCSTCGRNSTHFHCRICGYGTSQTANVVAHRRICISSSDLQQKECSRLTPTTDSTLMQLDVLPSSQSYPYYSSVGPAVSLPSSSTCPGTTNSTIMTTQPSPLFNFVIPSQSSQYSSLYSSPTVFPNPNLFSPSSYSSYGQLDPWLPQPRLIPPGVHSSSPSSDLLGSGRNPYDKLDSSSSPSCCGRIGSLETTAIGMCSPLTAEAYRIVSKESQSKVDSSNWCCSSQSVMTCNSQTSSCKYSDSCSIGLLLLEQNDLKSTEESINVEDLCFETGNKADLKSDLKENQKFTSCTETSRKSAETCKESAEKKGESDGSNSNRGNEGNVDSEPHAEESDIIVDELDSDRTQLTTLRSEMEQILLTRCLVCNKSPPDDDVFVKISGQMPVTTTTTQVSVLTKLSEVIDSDSFNTLTDCLICPRCLNLINVVDELEIKLNSAKKELVDIYKSKDSSDSNDVEDLDKRDLDSPKGSPRSKVSCDICKKKFSSSSNLEKHKQRHNKVFSYYCEYCGKGFGVLQKFEKHLTVHSKASRFQCELCGKRFSQKQYLMDHLTRHKGEFRFQCEICQKGFIRKAVYKKHLLIHGSEPCICHQCGKQLKNITYLYFHTKLCSGDLKFSCSKCDKKFPIKSLLRKHISVKHDSQYEYVCTVCRKGFGKKSDLETHMITHSDNKPHKCSKCNKAYKSLSNLNHHAKLHSSNQILECDVCGKIFTRIDSLKDHMNQHTGDKPYKCTDCSKEFSHRINYTNHMKRHSGTLKQTPCPVCGKMFNKGLRDHLVSHSGEKPHTCDHCGAVFTVRSSLNKHMKTKHNL